MFRSRTLFVVGAGASREAGLPTGVQLKATIAQLIDIRFEDGWNQSSGDHEITAALRRASPQDINSYLHAARAMRNAMPQALSIDNYLDVHRGDEKIELCGKLRSPERFLSQNVGAIFVDETQRDNMRFEKIDGTWYTNLMQLLTDRLCRVSIRQYRLYCLNYDRCIEHFFVHHYKNYYGLNAGCAQEIVNRTTILHSYGVVGRLPWQAEDGRGVQFGGSRHDLIEVAAQIKTFGERVEDKSALQTAREQVNIAETVVFLGFAFHPQNMELINPGEPCHHRRVFATALGISNSDCEVVRAQVEELSHGKGLQVHLRNDLTCAGLFNEFWRQLSLGT